MGPAADDHRKIVAPIIVLMVDGKSVLVDRRHRLGGLIHEYAPPREPSLRNTHRE